MSDQELLLLRLSAGMMFGTLIELACTMIKHYVVHTFRQFRMAPLYSVTNLLGLSVGSAAAILVFLFVRHELSYDRFHEHAGETHLLYWTANFGNVPFAPVRTGPLMQDLIPEIEETVSVYRVRDAYFAVDDELVQQNDVYLADSEFFSLLTFPLLSGDPEQVLSAPNSVVLTPESAEKYFGSTDAVGQSMLYKGETLLTVTGIAKPPPSNTHLPFEMVISMSTFVTTDTSPWAYQGYNYVQLVPEADLEGIVERMNEDDAIESIGWSIAGTTFGLMPIDRVHADADFFAFGADSSGQTLSIFSMIGVLLLLLASLNYVNLAVARALRRVTEIGMRQALGASRGQLALQFMGEATVVTGLSVLAGMGLAEMALPWFRAVLNVGMDLRLTGSAGMGLPLLGLWLVLSLAAGTYPAFSIARSSSHRNRRLTSNPVLRRSLVVVQFSISIVLVAGTLLVDRQLSYVSQLDIGYDRDRLIGIHLQGGAAENAEVFLGRVAGLAGVQSSALAYGMPNEIMATMSESEDGAPVQVHHLPVEAGYVETVGLNLLSGRDFAGNIGSDTTQILINETAVRHFELGDDPIGKEVQERTVIGVVEDFNTRSAREAMSPVLLTVDAPRIGRRKSVILRAGQGAKPYIIEQVAAIWKELEPGIPFVALDAAESWTSQYESEARLNSLTRVFSLLALFIASIGLFGLVSSTAEQRTKEIGIRKALGATAANVVGLLTREFAWLLVVALVVAGPAAYWFGRQWLAEFAFRIEFGPGLIILAAASAGALALATVGVRAWLAASVNPVDSLRSE